MSKLPLTGERTVPGWAQERYWYLRHVVVYLWIAAHHRRPADRIADIGSGEGFGADLLADDRAVAVELDASACTHARRSYPRVDTICANVVALPLSTGAFDLVVSLQVIEHIWDVPRYLAELRRICRGTAIISTPNRPVFSPDLPRGAKPINPFHVEEFDADQLRALCQSAGFADVTILGLHHGPRITAWEGDHGPLVPALVDAAITDRWPAPLMVLQASLRPDDFTITHASTDAHDLIAVTA